MGGIIPTGFIPELFTQNTNSRGQGCDPYFETGSGSGSVFYKRTDLDFIPAREFKIKIPLNSKFDYLLTTVIINYLYLNYINRKAEVKCEFD